MKFEYDIHFCPSDANAVMTELEERGKYGWLLCSRRELSNYQTELIFTRPLSDG